MEESHDYIPFMCGNIDKAGLAEIIQVTPTTLASVTSSRTFPANKYKMERAHRL